MKLHGDKCWQTFSETKVNPGLLLSSANVLHLTSCSVHFYLLCLYYRVCWLRAENYHTVLAVFKIHLFTFGLCAEKWSNCFHRLWQAGHGSWFHRSLASGSHPRHLEEDSNEAVPQHYTLALIWGWISLWVPKMLY